MMGRILILDGMWNKSLASVRSFGKRGFYVAAGERTPLATALFSKYCSRKFIYPSPVEYPGDFIDCLESELKKGSYDVVLAMEFSTQILLTEKSHRQRLERYARIPYVEAGLATKVNDKAYLMQYAKALGVDIPETYFVGLREIEDVASEIKYPAVIKPRVSSGSRGIIYVKNSSELQHSYRKVHEKYPFPLIQEFIPPGGEAYGVGLLLNFSSDVRASFPYRRIREYPISGGPSTLRESVRRDDIAETAEALMKALGWVGVAHVEFKVDPRDGRPKLLEVNPRFWGSLQLGIEAGVDFPYLLYKMAMEGDVETISDYKEGVKCRWLIPGDILHFIKNPKRTRIIRDFFDLNVKDDIISFEDPLPTVGRLLSGVTLFYDKEMRKLLKN